MTDNIPLPKDPRHQRFADRILAGDSLVDAYLHAGFKCNRESAYTAAKRLSKRADIRAYTQWIQTQAATDCVLSVAEKRKFFARIVRTPLTSINPDAKDGKDHDLIKKLVRKFNVQEDASGASYETCTETYEKLDPLKAIDLDNKLSGDDPEANAIKDLALSLASLGAASGTLPEDRM